MSINDLIIQIDAETKKADAQIDRFNKGLLKTEGQLRRAQVAAAQLEKELDEGLEQSLQRNHEAMEKVGRGLVVFGAAVGIGLGLATREAVKWESAWAGVTKTVDGSAVQMQHLEDGLRGMAQRLPATHDEIAAVAEAAGQLGIKRDAILSFTKTMIDLSVTTNLTADEAATSMARFSNIMQTPQGDIDRLGASLVALGNAGASTEAEILEMGLRIAGAGKQVGLTEGETLALANALSSLGIAAESGGSSVSTVLVKINEAVEEGGVKLGAFAEASGMSARAFAQQWQSDPAAALQSFVTGLQGIDRSGGSVLGTLRNLEITEIRQRDAILRLVGGGDLLAQSLRLGNRAWRENSALVEEAARRYQTTESRIRIACR